MRRFFLLLTAVAGLMLLLSLLMPPQPEIPPQQVNAASLGLFLLEEYEGLYVLAVNDSSPAARASILPGDVLLEANGVTLSTVTTLDQLLSQLASPLRLTLLRDEARLTLSLSLR